MTILLYTVGVVLFALALIFSIALHELGHLLVAKKFGCRVSEYMVGFGKTIFSFTPKVKGQPGETTYGLKLIPFGGYVKIIGMYPPEAPRKKRFAVIEEAKGAKDASDPAELSSLERAMSKLDAKDHGHPAQTSDAGAPKKSNIFATMIAQTRTNDQAQLIEGDEGREYYRLAWWRKSLVMLAGPMMNIAIAFFCFWALFGIYGVHSTDATGSTVIKTVSDCVIPDSESRDVCRDSDPVAPATLAGFEVGDEVIAANGQPVGSWDELSVFIEGHGDKEAVFTVLRDGQELDLKPVELSVMVRDMAVDSTEADLQPVGFVGIGPETVTTVAHYGPIYTLGEMGHMIENSVKAMVDLPAKVFNVAAAVAGVEERDNNGPVSVVGGSRIAGEVTSNTELGLNVADKAALLTSVIGSFNLFIGVFNLIPLVPLDGGHIFGAVYEKLRRVFAKVFKRRDPGFVDTAKQLPLAYLVAMSFVAMTLVLVVGDLVVPVVTGL